MGSLENKSQVKRSPPFYKIFGDLKEFAFFANMGFNDAFMNFLNKGGTAPDPKDEKTAPENKENLPGKKKYIPPYTPERTPIKPEDSARIILGNPAKKLDNSATKLDLYKESLKRIGVATKTKSETSISATQMTMRLGIRQKKERQIIQ